MRMIITGGLGFIGQNLVAHLRRRFPGASLWAIDRDPDAQPWELPCYDRILRACFADDHVLQFYDQADVVVHLAAETSVQASVAGPGETFRNNVVKTQKLLERLRRFAPRTHFVFASTGGALAGDGQTDAVDETLVPQPMSPYGASKLAVEGFLTAYRGSYELRSATLRFSNVYGPFGLRSHGVIPSFCRMALTTGRLIVNGDGAQTRDFVHAEDISEAIARVIEIRAEGVYQLGTGVATSVLEVAGILRRSRPELGLRVAHRPGFGAEIRHSLSDITKARRDLGFTPRHRLDDGIRATLEWFERNASLQHPWLDDIKGADQPRRLWAVG